MKSVCFIVNKYPNQVDPNGLVFVQQLVWTMADMGVSCTVICPLAVNLYPKLSKVPYHLVEETENRSLVDVFFPKYFGFGQSHYILGKSPVTLTTKVFTRAVEKTIDRNHIETESFYGHFLAPAGVCAAKVGSKYEAPAFVAYGEGSKWTIDQFGVTKLRRELGSISGIVAVSSKNKQILVDTDIVPEEKIGVFPNGFRPERFHPIDRQQARRKMGWDENIFIAGLVGSFDDRKGVLRLQAAAENLEDVYFACAGKGKLAPGGSRCIMAGPVNNKDLPYFYNAIDVFVLPTLNEGCSNAIIEAMACGCPIISSDRTFNYDICDEMNSILINPEDISEISDAIRTLKDDCVLRDKKGTASLKKAAGLTLEQRAGNVLEFMKSKCG